MSLTARETADARVWSQRVTSHDASTSPQQPLPPTTTTEGPSHDGDDGQGSRYFAQNSRACAVVPGPLLCTFPPLLFNFCKLAYTIECYSLFSMSPPPVLKILAHIISQNFPFHLFSLGVLEFFTTGGVLAINQYSRRARY